MKSTRTGIVYNVERTESVAPFLDIIRVNIGTTTYISDTGYTIFSSKHRYYYIYMRYRIHNILLTIQYTDSG